METRYGGLPMDTGRAAQVITATTLKVQDLNRLFRHEATALHIPGFYPTHAAAVWGRQLANQAQQGQGRNWKVSTSRGLESSDVTTLGEHAPLNVATALHDTQAYFEGVQREFRQRRQPLQQQQHQQQEDAMPILWPLDQLRLELDEAWPHGAGLARENQGQRRPFGGGLPRVMMGPTRWSKGFVHVDEMGPLDDKQGLFSANIYLQLPSDFESSSSSATTKKQQRALEIWPLGIRTRWDWYRVRSDKYESRLSSSCLRQNVRF